MGAKGDNGKRGPQGTETDLKHFVQLLFISMILIKAKRAKRDSLDCKARKVKKVT